MPVQVSRSFAPSHSNFSQEYRTVNCRILGAGSMLFAALMPAVWSGGQTAAILGLEAVLCLTLLGLRGRVHRNLCSTWELHSQAVLRRAARVVESD
jgi:hypothetical protein